MFYLTDVDDLLDVIHDSSLSEDARMNAAYTLVCIIHTNTYGYVSMLVAQQFKDSQHEE